ncbi:class I SAM-dependent methyltransferase [Nocardia sp. NPDC127579]|uniref:class I SAM-dependent methyltransferase n=1 Tax=Nocardia sp. NPDC127579 TaxID=3345402 RepID=UPI00363AB10A
MTLLARLDRFNQRHPWSHNDFYGRWVLGRVRSARAREVLDIGCGTGNLIDRLRPDVERVTGVEPDPDSARAAADRFAGDAAVVIEQLRFDQLPPRRWDAITLVASLHHLPLHESIPVLDRSLNPGGRLIVIGCYRASSLLDHFVGGVAALANPLLGLLKHPRVAERLPHAMTAPTAPPRETLTDIRAAARAHLPGARIRRRLFWRYSLVYDKPGRLPTPPG